MDDKIQKKLNELVASVEARNVRYHKAIIRTTVIYVVLAAIVLGYTSFIYFKLKELATPENVASLLVDCGKEKLPLIREGAREKMPEAAAMVADKVVESGIAFIPTAGTYARTVIDEQVDALLDKLEKKDMKVIEQYLDDSLTIILENEKVKNPNDLVNALNKQVSAKLNEELDKIINSEYYQAIAKLQTELNLLRTKKTKNMTSLEFAERDFIFCWLRLNELAEMEDCDDSFLSMLSGLTGSAADWLGNDDDTDK